MKRAFAIFTISLLLSSCSQAGAVVVPTATISPTLPSPTSTPLPMAPMDDFMKGVVYTHRSEYDYSSIGSDRTINELIRPLGATWIEIMLSCLQIDSSNIEIVCGPSVGTPPDYSLRHAIRKAKENGLRVMLKPQIHFVSKSIPIFEGVSGSDKAWSLWFSNYTLMITNYARLAQEENVDAFNIGTELTHSSHREEDWRRVVDAVRSEFSGPLVYGANWDEVELIQWWDAVDYIGVDAYYPLTRSSDPSVDELVHAWQNHVASLEDLSKKWDRQVIITEIGYNSLDGANNTFGFNPLAEIDLQEQADCYSAVLKAFHGKSWWRGIFFWDWIVGPNQGGEFDSSFNIHNKPAEEVLRLAYGGSNPGIPASPTLVPDYENTYSIYSGQLAQGWEDFSWNSLVDLNSSQITYLEKPSIKVVLLSDGGFSLWNDGFNAKDYSWLEFYIFQPVHADQKLQVVILESDEKIPPYYLRIHIPNPAFVENGFLISDKHIPNPEFVENGIFIPDQWVRVRIPLSYLMEPVGIIRLINLQSDFGEGDFYLAEIRLVGSK